MAKWDRPGVPHKGWTFYSILRLFGKCTEAIPIIKPSQPFSHDGSGFSVSHRGL